MKKAARRIDDHVEVVWGDVRSPEDLAAAVKDQDVIMHLAFILPPASEDRPQWAREINVAGTENLLQAMKTVLPPPKIIFSSTFSVFGDTQSQPPPRTVSDPVKPVDNYTRHKVECERLVQEIRAGLGQSFDSLLCPQCRWAVLKSFRRCSISHWICELSLSIRVMRGWPLPMR